MKGDTLENKYYELSDLSSKLNIKTGDRIFLKSGYGTATDDEWHNDAGVASTKATDCCNEDWPNPNSYKDNIGWGDNPFRGSIGIPYSVGYYTDEDNDGEIVQVWNPLQAQDWNGNFVSLAEHVVPSVEHFFSAVSLILFTTPIFIGTPPFGKPVTVT